MKENNKMKLLRVVCILFLVLYIGLSAEASQSHIFSNNLALQQDDSSSDKSKDTQTSREKKK